MKLSIKDVFRFLTNRDPSPLENLLKALEENHPVYIENHSENSILRHSNRSLPTWMDELNDEPPTHTNT